MSINKTSYFSVDSCIGNRVIDFDRAGERLEGHYHNFPHDTFCSRGRLQVDVTDALRTEVKQSRVLDAGESCLIRAGELHTLTALADNTRANCIYAHRTPRGEIVQEYTGWDEAYTNRSNPPTTEIMAALVRGEDTHGNNRY